MPRKLLLDTDPGCDDAVAIAVALAAPELDVVGLTTVAGNTTLENTTRNAGAVLELFDRTDVPVAPGCDRPISRELENAEEVHGPGGIRGDLPDPTTSPVEEHAVEFILEAAREHGDELVIAAVGPCTNLATAMLVEPELPELVDDIYLMGGAAMVGGNVTPEAEFNFYVDPEAASHVIRHGSPRMVGLDATNRATVPMDRIVDLAERPSPYEEIASWLGYMDAADIRESGVDRAPSVHDAQVIVDVVDDIVTYETYPLEVGTGAGHCRGAVICDQRDATDQPPNAEVAVDVDVEGFRSRVTAAFEEL